MVVRWNTWWPLREWPVLLQANAKLPPWRRPWLIDGHGAQEQFTDIIGTDTESIDGAHV